MADHATDAAYAASRPALTRLQHDIPTTRNGSSATRYHFWCGASGERYVHTVHALTECPELPAANYVLVRRDGAGAISTCAIGRVDEGSPSQNLAEIRHRGALMGATEVHVHLLADSAKRSKLVAFDIQAGQFGGGQANSDTRH